MKQTTNIQRSISQLYKMFDALDEHYFDNELPRPVINCLDTPKAYGHFCPWNAYRIKQDDGTYTGNVELSIAIGTLDRPIENVTATLLHEMTHYYCYLHKIKDTSRSGQYHNKRFRQEAEKRGLSITYDPRIGWSITEPTDELIEFIISCGWDDFRIGRNDYETYTTGITGTHNTTGTTTTGTTPKGNSHKLVCPCCGLKIRYTTQQAPRVMCMDCNTKMVEA